MVEYGYSDKVQTRCSARRCTLLLVGVSLAMTISCRGGDRSGSTDTPSAQKSQNRTESADTSKSSPLRPTIRMRTNMGDITLELDAENAPNNTLNFLEY